MEFYQQDTIELNLAKGANKEMGRRKRLFSPTRYLKDENGKRKKLMSPRFLA